MFVLLSIVKLWICIFLRNKPTSAIKTIRVYTKAVFASLKNRLFKNNSTFYLGWIKYPYLSNKPQIFQLFLLYLMWFMKYLIIKNIGFWVRSFKLLNFSEEACIFALCALLHSPRTIYYNQLGWNIFKRNDIHSIPFLTTTKKMSSCSLREMSELN